MTHYLNEVTATEYAQSMLNRWGCDKYTTGFVRWIYGQDGEITALVAAIGSCGEASYDFYVWLSADDQLTGDIGDISGNYA